MPRSHKIPAAAKPPPKQAGADIQALFQAALSAHQSGRLAEAEGGYRQVLSLNARHADALHLLGVAHLQRGHFAEAEQWIRQALAVQENPFFLGNLGNALRNAGRLPEAEAACRRALALMPDYADAHNNLGNLLRDTQRLAEAETAYRRAVDIQPDQIDAHNNLANLFKDAGRLAEAEAAYRRILQLKPADLAAHNHLGGLLVRGNRLAEAEASFRRVLELNPDHAEGHYNLGNLLKNSKRLDEAETAYRRVLALMPDHADTHNNLANLLKGAGRLTEAEAAYTRALALKPDHADAHNNLGNLLQTCKRGAEAEAAYRRALAVKPDHVDALNNLGNLLHSSKRSAEAETCYRRALELKPDHVEALNNLGLSLQETKRLPEAEATYQRALALQPDYIEARFNLGIALQEGKRLPEAEAAYRRAIELKPDYVDAYINLGNLLQHSRRLPEAEAAYGRALVLDPGHVDAHNNLGALFQSSKRMAESEASYRRALAINPDDPDVRFNLALFLLTLQRYAEGWPLHESRYSPHRKDSVMRAPQLGYPQWQGEALAGKSLLIMHEQGFGDSIQFVRYAALLRQRGVSRLTLICPPALKALLETVDGIDAVVTDLAQAPAHDYWSFLMSLPLYCGTAGEAIPAAVPYVRSLPARVAQWQGRLPAHGLKVGLVWKGSSLHKNDGNRSLPHLSALAPLWSVPGVVFISLQKGQGEEEAAAAPEGQALVDLGPQMQDFADTAAIVSQLDLVICVDTALAHVAGALNKPCWILLPAMGSDWRWQLDRTDSPWYPGVRLFRQSHLHDWSDTVGDVTAALGELLQKSTAEKSSMANAGTLFQAGFSAHQSGRMSEAADWYLKVLSIDNRHADALHLLGVVHLQAGRLAEAETWIRKALELQESAIFLGNLGSVLRNSGRLPEAETAWRRAVALKPDYADAHINLGNLLKGTARHAEAEAAYRQVIALRPDQAEVHNNLGVVLRQSNRLDEAEAAHKRAIELNPRYADAHFNLAIVLQEGERPSEAEAAYGRVLQLKPDYVNAHINLSNLLKEGKRLGEAETALRRALSISPDLAEAHNNLGALLLGSNRLAEAEACYRRALELKPDAPDVRFNLGLLLLAQRRYEEGWVLHESRYAPGRKDSAITAPTLGFPQWQGEEISGKSLLIWSEQGFGDYVQFVRYAALLKRRGVSRLTLVCRPALKALLETVEGVDAVTDDFAQIKAHDFWCFLMSLPLRFATTEETIPAALPYVHASPSRLLQWKDRLPANGRRVGLVWKGSSLHVNDANRSLPHLSILAPLWSVPGVVFISLQKDQGEGEAMPPPPGQSLVALGASMKDFADTAAIVSQLDLVICVDTALAHVAGALNKPCWILLPAMGTDWRWQLERSDSPWYPSVRLFRQPQPYDWGAVVDEVAAGLSIWARSSPEPDLSQGPN